MHFSIRIKLLLAFLSVVAVFAIGGFFALQKVDRVGHDATRFITVHWPTADLIMEARISYDDIARQVFSPDPEMDTANFLEISKSRLAGIRDEFRQTELDVEDIAQVTANLELVEQTLDDPVRLYQQPGERMEVADALVDDVLEGARALDDASLVSIIWEVVMAFNDILITRNSAELDNFKRHTAQIERHPGFDTFAAAYRPFKESAERVFQSAEALHQAQKRFSAAGEELGSILRRLEDDYDKEVVVPMSIGVQNGVEQAHTWLIFSIFISAIVSLFIGFGMSRSFGRAIGKLVAAMTSMGQGHLDQPLKLPRTDEFGTMADVLDRMRQQLNGMVQRINSSSGQLIDISKEISETSESVEGVAKRLDGGVNRTAEAVGQIQSSIGRIGRGVEQLVVSAEQSTSSALEMTSNTEEVAQTAESAANSVDEVHSSIMETTTSLTQIADSIQNLKEAADVTASSSEEMDSTIRQVETNTRNTLTIADDVRKDAQEGQVAVTETINGMTKIRQASQVATDAIQSLSGRVKDIGTILSTIEDITDQTGLLALNAAIIAAQAGEHGKGFAVVAEEIRELSTRTNHSTSEITLMIQAVQQETSRVVSSMETAQMSILEGEALSQQSGSALDKIVKGASGVVTQMDQVARATQEQASGSGVMRQAMDQITVMVDQIATATGEQQKASGLIMKAAENILDSTRHVKGATLEQANTSRVIAESAENVKEMISSIKGACDAQSADTRQIEGVVKEIETSTGDSVAMSQGLKQTVVRLSNQVELLRTEMDAFRTGNEEVEPNQASQGAEGMEAV